MRTFKCKFELCRGRDKRASFNSAGFRAAGTLLRTQLGGFTDSMPGGFFG
jgi:hypothetical protein